MPAFIDYSCSQAAVKSPAAITKDGGRGYRDAAIRCRKTILLPEVLVDLTQGNPQHRHE
jgi:hypothetical protein